MTEKKTKKDVPIDAFKHSTPIQLRFKDGDNMGHVNNANHFTYMEIARINYFNDVVDSLNKWKKNGIILAKISIDYIKPILLGESIIVYTRCTHLGNKSMKIDYQIRKRVKETEVIMAEGSSIIVCYDYEKGQSVTIPAKWRKKIMAYDQLSSQ